MHNIAFTVRDLSFGYTGSTVLDNLQLDFEPGKFHAIIGPNGSGKTTLLDILAGHRRPASGSITMDGKSIGTYAPEKLARLVATVPQEFDFRFPFTVYDAVLMGRHPHISRFSRPSEDDLAIVESALGTMDIGHLAERTLAELSGGEKQRTVVARALAQATPALLLDEPTSSMDIRHALTTLAQLRRLAHKEGRTVIAVLHDLNLAAAHCDRVILLKNGSVHTQGSPADALTPETISNVFGVTASILREDPMVISYNS